MKQRIETLDYLRGLMALSIMFYHLTYWSIMPLDSSNLLGRLGIYGVSIFFILSGLSMAIVYNNYINSFRTSVFFYIRRIFRIWPLLWVVTLLIIIPKIVDSGTFSIKLILLNLTTLFGFLTPTKYIATGAWSIGNEMVYYAMTPIIFLLYNYKLWLGNALFAFTVLIGFIFAFYFLDFNQSLASQWNTYVNPFNNLFLYFGGVALYFNFNNLVVKPQIINSVLVISVLLFCFLPFDGNQISIVTGLGRIVFVILSFIIVFCFYKLKITLPKFMSYSLETFGLATYGVYLIHPIIFGYLNNIFAKIHLNNSYLIIITVVGVTLLISIFSYRYFELGLIKIGKKITSINKTN